MQTSEARPHSPVRTNDEGDEEGDEEEDEYSPPGGGRLSLYASDRGVGRRGGARCVGRCGDSGPTPASRGERRRVGSRGAKGWRAVGCSSPKLSMCARADTMRVKLPSVSQRGEADCSAANTLLQEEDRIIPSLLAVQRGLERAAAYEACSDAYPMVRLPMVVNGVAQEGEADCSAANTLLQEEDRIIPSLLAVQRGLERAAAYEACSDAYPMVRLPMVVNGVAQEGEADCSAANALLQPEGRVASSLQAMQRGLARAAQYEGCSDACLVVRLPMVVNGVQQLAEADCRAANALLQDEERIAPSTDAMHRGLERAAAYEASSNACFVLRLPIVVNGVHQRGEDDCRAANALLHEDARVALSVQAMQRGLVRMAGYEAADMLSWYCHDGTCSAAPPPMPLWCDMTAVNGSLEASAAMAPYLDAMRWRVWREHEQRRLRENHKDELLLRSLPRSAMESPLYRPSRVQPIVPAGALGYPSLLVPSPPMMSPYSMSPSMLLWPPYQPPPLPASRPSQPPPPVPVCSTPLACTPPSPSRSSGPSAAAAAACPDGSHPHLKKRRHPKKNVLKTHQPLSTVGHAAGSSPHAHADRDPQQHSLRQPKRKGKAGSGRAEGSYPLPRSEEEERRRMARAAQEREAQQRANGMALQLMLQEEGPGNKGRARARRICA